MNQLNLTFTFRERSIAFSMTYDADFVADRNMLGCLRNRGACEPEVMNVMWRALRPGDTAVDGGANVGFFSMFMAKLIGPTGCVHAYEPDLRNHEKLLANGSLNKVANLVPCVAPLWSAHEEVTLYLAAADTGSSSLRDNGCPGKRIVWGERWDIMGGVPRLMKLDVEGAELHVLKGCGKYMAPYMIVELNDEALPRFGTNSAEVRAFMRERGYDMFILHPNGMLPTLVPTGTKIRTNRLNFNVLFATVENVGALWPVEEDPYS